MVKIITVTKDNLEQAHICCAIANNKDYQVAAKKSWLAERFADGLVFKKGVTNEILSEKKFEKIIADKGYKRCHGTVPRRSIGPAFLLPDMAMGRSVCHIVCE